MLLTNKRLYDVLTRHQIYVEGVKDHNSKEFKKVTSELAKELRIIFSRIEYQNLDSLTKRELKSLLIEVREKQWVVYNKHYPVIIKELKSFIFADKEISVAIFNNLTQSDVQNNSIKVQEEGEKEEKPVLTASYFDKNEKSENKLWAYIKNQYIPASGLLLLPTFTRFFNNSAFLVENAITMGHSNKTGVNETLKDILGTKANRFNDGIFSKINRNFSSEIHTAIQHATSITQAAISSLFFDRYRWVAVLDSKTTEICRSRDNKIYYYGKGPLPPAHYRCRSKTVPLVGGLFKEPDNFKEWLKEQPIEFQKDVLNSENFDKMKTGKLKENDLKKFENEKTLSIKGFSSKLELILKD